MLPITKHIFVSFKTKVSPTLSLTKMKMPDYIEATEVTCVGMAVDQEPTFSVAGSEIEALREPISAIIAATPTAVFAHNIAFHQAVWRKLKWPEPTEWCCTMAVMKREQPKEKKFNMPACAERLGLPPRITVDEMGLNGKCTNDLLRSVERDASLVRGIAETILQKPLTEIL